MEDFIFEKRINDELYFLRLFKKYYFEHLKTLFLNINVKKLNIKIIKDVFESWQNNTPTKHNYTGFVITMALEHALLMTGFKNFKRNILLSSDMFDEDGILLNGTFLTYTTILIVKNKIDKNKNITSKRSQRRKNLRNNKGVALSCFKYLEI